MRFALRVQPRNMLLFACHLTNATAQGVQIIRMLVRPLHATSAHTEIPHGEARGRGKAGVSHSSHIVGWIGLILSIIVHIQSRRIIHECTKLLMRSVGSRVGRVTHGSHVGDFWLGSPIVDVAPAGKLAQAKESSLVAA